MAIYLGVLDAIELFVRKVAEEAGESLVEFGRGIKICFTLIALRTRAMRLNVTLAED